MTAPKHRRILAATILALILGIAGILAWQLAPKGDPILGSWGDGPPYDPFAQQYHFHADHRITVTGFQPAAGTWKLIPGPYYERMTVFTPIDDLLTKGSCRYVSPAQFTPERFQSAIASNAFLPAGANAQVRLYECEFPPTASTPYLERYIACLDAGKLNLHDDTAAELERPGTWLTQAWDWLRGLLP